VFNTTVIRQHNCIENTDITQAYVASGLPTLTNSCFLDQFYVTIIQKFWYVSYRDRV